MKLRMLAMATVAAAALSTPAMAGQGWYLGLGGGYSGQESQTFTSVPRPATGSLTFPSSDNAIGMLSVGYAWGNGWRLENEIALTSHDVKRAGFNGGGQITSSLFNLTYDIPLGDTWKFTLGGGVGVGNYRTRIGVNGTNFDYVKGRTTAFQWQGIAGLAVSISPDVDLFGEYRYRSNETNANFGSSYLTISPVHIDRVSENVAMFGLRWFMTPPLWLIDTDNPRRSERLRSRAMVSESLDSRTSAGAGDCCALIWFCASFSASRTESPFWAIVLARTTGSGVDTSARA